MQSITHTLPFIQHPAHSDCLERKPAEHFSSPHFLQELHLSVSLTRTLSPLLTKAAFLAGGSSVSVLLRGFTAATAEGEISAALRFSARFVGVLALLSEGFTHTLHLATVRGRESWYSCASRGIQVLLSFPQPLYAVKYIWPAKLHCPFLNSLSSILRNIFHTVNTAYQQYDQGNKETAQLQQITTQDKGSSHTSIPGESNTFLRHSMKFNKIHKYGLLLYLRSWSL